MKIVSCVFYDPLKVQHIEFSEESVFIELLKNEEFLQYIKQYFKEHEYIIGEINHDSRTN